jgi:hypothetical protein
MLREFAATQARAARAAAKQKAEAERLQLELEAAAERLQLELQQIGASPSAIKRASQSLEQVLAEVVLVKSVALLNYATSSTSVLQYATSTATHSIAELGY